MIADTKLTVLMFCADFFFNRSSPLSSGYFCRPPRRPRPVNGASASWRAYYKHIIWAVSLKPKFLVLFFAQKCLKTCVNCILKFNCFFFNLSSKVPAGVRVERQNILTWTSVWMNGWMNEWMNDKAACRTAMATPGLLIITVILYYSVNWRIELHIKISLQSSGSVCFYETVEWLKHTIILHYKATLSLCLQAMVKRYWCQSPSSVYQLPISSFSKFKICLRSKLITVYQRWSSVICLSICYTFTIFLIMTWYQLHATYFGSKRCLGGNTQVHPQTVQTVHFQEGRTPFCTICTQWQGNTLAKIKCPWTVQFLCGVSANKQMHCC